MIPYTCTKFGVHMYHEQTHKKCPGPKRSVQQEVRHFDFCCHFYTFLSLVLLLQISHHRLHIQSVSFSEMEMKCYQELLPTSHMVGVVVRSISILCHKTGSPYNFNMQFSICTTFLTHVEGVILNKSVHQYCVTATAPPS